jgi:hypothetical protein
MMQFLLTVHCVDIWTQQVVSRNVNLKSTLGDVNISTTFITSNCYRFNLLDDSVLISEESDCKYRAVLADP